MPNYLSITVKTVQMSWAETKHHFFPLRVHFVVLSLFLMFAAFGREIKHNLRRRIGDDSKRPKCCALRPDIYERMSIRDIPEFVDIIVRRSAAAGYTEYYDCKICGQGWVQLIAPEVRGKGLRWDVKKI